VRVNLGESTHSRGELNRRLYRKNRTPPSRRWTCDSPHWVKPVVTDRIWEGIQSKRTPKLLWTSSYQAVVTRRDRTVEKQYKPGGLGRLSGRVPGGISWALGTLLPILKTRHRFDSLPFLTRRPQAESQLQGTNVVPAASVGIWVNRKPIENWSERTQQQSTPSGLLGVVSRGSQASQ